MPGYHPGNDGQEQQPKSKGKKKPAKKKKTMKLGGGITRIEDAI